VLCKNRYLLGEKKFKPRPKESEFLTSIPVLFNMRVPQRGLECSISATFSGLVHGMEAKLPSRIAADNRP